MEEHKDWHKLWAMPVPLDDEGPVGWRSHINWCTELWGDKGTKWEYTGAGGQVFRGETWRFVGQGWFKFKREQDATLFALKWV